MREGTRIEAHRKRHKVAARRRRSPSNHKCNRANCCKFNDTKVRELRARVPPWRMTKKSRVTLGATRERTTPLRRPEHQSSWPTPWNGHMRSRGWGAPWRDHPASSYPRIKRKGDYLWKKSPSVRNRSTTEVALAPKEEVREVKPSPMQEWRQRFHKLMRVSFAETKKKGPTYAHTPPRQRPTGGTGTSFSIVKLRRTVKRAAGSCPFVAQLEGRPGRASWTGNAGA